MNTMPPDVEALCLAAQRAYWNARGTLERAQRHLSFLEDYREHGHMLDVAWPDLFADFGQAQASAMQYEALIAQLATRGVSREEALMARVPMKAPSEFELLHSAYVDARRALSNYARPKPTPAMRRKGRAAAGLPAESEVGHD